MDNKIKEFSASIVSEYASKTAEPSVLAMNEAFRKNNINAHYYFMEIKENGLCVMFHNDKWELSYLDRGDNNIIASYDNIDDACERIISLIGKEKKMDVMQDYEKLKKPYYVSPHDLGTIISNHIKKIAVF